jgi:hypothetical protein
MNSLEVLIAKQKAYELEKLDALRDERLPF